MIKDFNTYVNEGLFDRSQSEFGIRKTDKGIEQIYIPKTKNELYSYINLDIEQAKKDRTYPNVDLNNIDVSKLGDDELNGLFGNVYDQINPDISNWNIEYIPINFFYNNKKIKEFTIPNSATSIEALSFAGCSRLKSVTIPNSVKSIKYGVFEHCNRLTVVTIPNSVTSIGDYAFGWCKGLTSIIIPNSVTTIGWGAFFDCKNLNTVIISKHCDIADNSFPRNCKIIKK